MSNRAAELELIGAVVFCVANSYPVAVNASLSIFLQFLVQLEHKMARQTCKTREKRPT